jgi:hypothetical protein
MDSDTIHLKDVIENVLLNFEGDLAKLPKDILVYKIETARALCSKERCGRDGH